MRKNKACSLLTLMAISLCLALMLTACNDSGDDSSGGGNTDGGGTVTPHVHVSDEYVSENELPATCGKDGSYDAVAYCTECGEEISRTKKTLEALTHDYYGGFCKHCNERQPDSIGLEFVSYGNGTCYLADLGSCTENVIVIPEKSSDGDTVVAIGDEALSIYTGITGIVIPKNVTTISPTAVRRMPNLKYITVIEGNEHYKSVDGVLYTADGKTLVQYPTGVESTAFTVPSGVTQIGAYAFSGSKYLESVTTSGASRIGEYAFSGCARLKSVTLSDGIECIGAQCFSECEALMNVSIADSIRIIESEIFYSCEKLEYTVYQGAEYLGNSENPYLVYVRTLDKTVASCEIHEDTKIIYRGAFMDCTALTSITLPESVSYIGSYAFINCSLLKEINTPAALLAIGNGAFSDCKKLEGFTLPEGIEVIEADTFRGCERLQTITLPESVRSIEDYAFIDCKSLGEIVMNDGLEKIGVYVFGNCKSLTQVIIPDSVKEIGYYAFTECSSLSGISLPTGITEIAWSTFNNCTSLDFIYIPNNVNVIGKSAFSGCTGLKTVMFGNGACFVDESAFVICYNIEAVLCYNWNNINVVDFCNSDLTEAKIYAYSEALPTDSGNYWYFDEDGDVALWP